MQCTRNTAVLGPYTRVCGYSEPCQGCNSRQLPTFLTACYSFLCYAELYPSSHPWRAFSASSLYTDVSPIALITVLRRCILKPSTMAKREDIGYEIHSVIDFADAVIIYCTRFP